MLEAKPTYHLPPNFSIPPPSNGPFHLGTVLQDFEKKEQMQPLNQEDSQRIPIPKKHEDVKRGFTATRKRMKSGEFGSWAKCMGLDGIGGKAGIAAKRQDSDRYTLFSVIFPRKTIHYVSAPKVIRVFAGTHSRASKHNSFIPPPSTSRIVSSCQMWMTTCKVRFTKKPSIWSLESRLAKV